MINESLASLFDDDTKPSPTKPKDQFESATTQPDRRLDTPEEVETKVSHEEMKTGSAETVLATQHEQHSNQSAATHTIPVDTPPPPSATVSESIFEDFDCNMPTSVTMPSKRFVPPWQRKAVARQEIERIMKTPTRTVKTVLVANTKGGSGKTPLAVMLAAAFGQVAGRQPVLIDNNPTGNLASRVSQMPADALTIDDLALNLDAVEANPDLVRDYLMWQPESYYALPSRPRKLIEQPDGSKVLDRPTISQAEAAGVWEACSKISRLLIIDSGNNDADDAWRGMLPFADLLVIPVRWSSDYCRAAFDMLRTLEATGYRELASKAIIVQTAPTDVYARRRSNWEERFTRARLQVMKLPVEKHLALNANIVWDMLKQTTRDAVCELAATIATRLAR